MSRHVAACGLIVVEHFARVATDLVRKAVSRYADFHSANIGTGMSVRVISRLSVLQNAISAWPFGGT